MHLLAASAIAAGATVIGVLVTVVGVCYTVFQVRMIAKDAARRAEFQVEVRLESPTPVRTEEHQDGNKAPDVFVVTCPRGKQLAGVLRIKFENTGDRRAEQTLLNVNAPTYLTDFYLSNQKGERKNSDTVTVADWNLKDLNGSDTPAGFLGHLDAVITRRHHYVRYVHFTANDPLPNSIPFYVNLDSDDLSDEFPDGVELHVWVKVEYEDEHA